MLADRPTLVVIEGGQRARCRRHKWQVAWHQRGRKKALYGLWCPVCDARKISEVEVQGA